MGGRQAGHVLLMAAATLVLAAAPTSVSAQAWLPARGEGTVSIVFSTTLSKDHFLPDRRADLGHIDAHSLLVDITVGIADRVAVSAAIPLVVSRYRGGNPHGPPVTLDDGAWHSNLQDLRLNVRFNLSPGPLVITPFVGVILPSHAYEFFAHAAPGRQRREVVGGIALARLFAEVGLVVQGWYAYGVAERSVEIRPQYSEAALEVAYFVTDRIRVFAQASGRFSHTGIDLTRQARLQLPADVWRHHDRASQEHVLNVGTGASVSVTDSVGVFGSYTSTVAGRNTHAINRGITAGVTWSFSRSSGSITRASRAGL